MRIQLRTYGVWRFARAIDTSMAAAVERMGYGAIWIGGSPGGELEQIEAILDATETIPVATGIVNMWRDEAEDIAEAYHRIAARHPDRFLLGVGIGHPEAIADYAKPFDNMVDYLDRLDASGVPRDNVVLAALGPRALRLSAERTVGAHPYLTTPAHTRLARELVGPGPLLAPEQKVVLDPDPAQARQVGRAIVQRYLTRVNYRNNLLREGWSEEDFADGGSDRLVDALVRHGQAGEVVAGINVHLEAGADHVGIQALGDDPVADYEKLASLLFG